MELNVEELVGQLKKAYLDELPACSSCWVTEKDPVTYPVAVELLADEVRHEEFLENLLGRKKHR